MQTLLLTDMHKNVSLASWSQKECGYKSPGLVQQRRADSPPAWLSSRCVPLVPLELPKVKDPAIFKIFGCSVY